MDHGFTSIRGALALALAVGCGSGDSSPSPQRDAAVHKADATADDAGADAPLADAHSSQEASQDGSPDTGPSTDAGCGSFVVATAGEDVADSGICDLAKDKQELAEAGLPPWHGVGTQLCGVLFGGSGVSCGPCPSGQTCVAECVCGADGKPIAGEYYTGSCAP